MKNIWKKGMALALSLTLLLGTTVTTKGMTLFYANKGRSGTKIYVEAKFTPDVLTTSTQYGLKKGKYVKKVKIRLHEGSYDKTKSTTTAKKIRLEKANNPLITSSASWTWYYK